MTRACGATSRSGLGRVIGSGWKPFWPIGTVPRSTSGGHGSSWPRPKAAARWRSCAGPACPSPASAPGGSGEPQPPCRRGRADARRGRSRAAGGGAMAENLPAGHKTLGADKGYDTPDFVMKLRELGITPQSRRTLTRRKPPGAASAIDGRTTRHAGYALSQRKTQAHRGDLRLAEDHRRRHRCWPARRRFA